MCSKIEGVQYIILRFMKYVKNIILNNTNIKAVEVFE